MADKTSVDDQVGTDKRPTGHRIDGGRSSRFDAHRDAILRLYEAQPDLPLDALCRELSRSGIEISRSSLYRFFERNGIDRDIGPGLQLATPKEEAAGLCPTCGGETIRFARQGELVAYERPACAFWQGEQLSIRPGSARLLYLLLRDGWVSIKAIIEDAPRSTGDPNLAAVQVSQLRRALRAAGVPLVIARGRNGGHRLQWTQPRPSVQEGKVARKARLGLRHG